LVLDLDMPADESEGALMHRAWLAFCGVSEITWPLEGARVPNGIWTSGAMEVGEATAGFSDFRVSTLAPRHDENDAVLPSPHRQLTTIRAQQLIGAVSIEAASPSKFDALSREQRQTLVRDEDLIEMILGLERTP